MSSTGTRPPLFDPEPGGGNGFDAELGGPRQQFPLRRSGGGGPEKPRRSSSGSPRWVRPFIFGGLLLVVLVVVMSMFGRDETPEPDPGPVADTTTQTDPAEETAPVGQADPADEPDPADPADPADTADQAVIEDDEPATPDAPADAGPDDVPTAETDAVPAEGSTADDPAPDVADPAAQGQFAAVELQTASAFGVQFAHDYLNYDEAQPDVRAREMGAYLAPGLDPQLGWNGQGTQLAVLTVPLETTVADDRVTVTIAAQVTGQDAPRWVHLAVPLERDDQERWAVVAAPAYVPRPAAGNPVGQEASETDQALSGELTAGIGQLFEAYAAESTVAVSGVTAPGATIRGLAGLVTFVEVDAVRIGTGDDTGRDGIVTVTWNDPVTDGSFSQDYDITLVGADGTWLVQEVRTG